MRKASLLRLGVVLAKISRRVKKLLRNNRSLDANRTSAEENCFSVRSCRFRSLLQRIFERGARGVQPAIPILKKPSHFGRYARVRQRIKRAFSLDIPQIQRVSRIQINDASIRRYRSDTISASGVMERNQLHADVLA